MLKILFLDPNECRSAIRADIREDLAKEAEAGGDAPNIRGFYAPFWAAAKKHVFDGQDLRKRVDELIALNPQRKNIYPRLCEGFLLWWDQRRRWTNLPFSPGRPIKKQFPFPGLGVTVKIDNILSVKDGLDVERAVYPYYFPKPGLSDEAARWGLWLLTTALPEIPRDEFRVLDVIRGRTFSLDRTPLQGNEEDKFRRRYTEVLRLWDTLRKEY